MKILSEKDIHKISSEGRKILDEAGIEVKPFKYQRPEKVEKKESKVNWIREYAGKIITAMQAASQERSVLNGLMAQIATTLDKKALKDDGKQIVPPSKWIFSISRDQQGFIKEIEARRG